MRVAIVADWLPTLGGAEQVITALHRLWPSAPVFTTIANHGQLGALDSATINTTPLQRWYKRLGTHRPLLPWMPRAIENIDLHDYDVIISSSHAIGKGIVPPSHAVHVCYCHTPMRYAWEMEDEYLHDFGVPGLLQGAIKKMLSGLRRWDLTTAQRVDVFIANSHTTRERIERIYGREATVVHPPAADRYYQTDLVPYDQRRYYFAVGRMVPYKRFDLLIDWANASQQPLKIAGTGPEFEKLKQRAGATVELLGYVPDADLPAMYANATAFLFPQFEDAGVVPLEAQAAGTPVIAYGKGGALDTVADGKTGLFFREQTVAEVTDGVKRSEAVEWSPAAIRDHAQQFTEERFRLAMTSIVEKTAKREQPFIKKKTDN